MMFTALTMSDLLTLVQDLRSLTKFPNHIDTIVTVPNIARLSRGERVKVMDADISLNPRFFFFQSRSDRDTE